MSEAILRRFTPQSDARRVQTRKVGDAESIFGYAAVFYREGDASTVYRLFDDVEERILPGTFDRAIREGHDVRALFNHDSSKVLGRTKSGTARISVDATGLRYEVDVPETTTGRDTAISLARGDIDGSSFAMIPTKTRWIEEGDLLVREIMDLDLFDVGPVTYPAYEGASSGARSEGLEDLRKAAEEFRSNKKRSSQSVAVNLRLLDLQE